MIVNTRRSTVPVGHTGIASYGMGFKNAIFRRNVVDVHRAVAALGGNIFVEGIPSNTLNKVSMLGNFANAFSWSKMCSAMTFT
jgi:hypothetical protein